MEQELIQKLQEAYPDNPEDIELIALNLDKVEEHITTELMAEHLEKAQQIVNRLYGLKPAGVMIDVQVLINELRCKYDITDPREIINWDNGKGYVQ